MTAKQTRFVELFLISLNATQAYREAYGCSEVMALRSGPRLLGNVGVAEAIGRAQAERSRRTGITADAVLARYWSIANADPRELIEYRRTCCRYCHGINFDYQFTRAELARTKTSWESVQTKSSTAQFNELGGIGYNGTLPPHPKCPECFGEGIERAFVHDTRKLSPAALTLYAGVKQTKDGIEVKMHDQHAALTNVAKHLGFFALDNEPPPSDDATVKRLMAALIGMDVATIGKAA